MNSLTTSLCVCVFIVPRARRFCSESRHMVADCYSNTALSWAVYFLNNLLVSATSLVSLGCSETFYEDSNNSQAASELSAVTLKTTNLQLNYISVSQSRVLHMSKYRGLEKYGGEPQIRLMALTGEESVYKIIFWMHVVFIISPRKVTRSRLSLWIFVAVGKHGSNIPACNLCYTKLW